jgi:hypothetical protein
LGPLGSFLLILSAGLFFAVCHRGQCVTYSGDYRYAVGFTRFAPAILIGRLIFCVPPLWIQCKTDTRSRLFYFFFVSAMATADAISSR